MGIRLISVGSKIPAWVDEGFQEYSKRLSRGPGLELIELPLAHRGKNPDIKRLMQQEGDAILKHIKPSDWVVAMEVKGHDWTTEKLAQNLQSWQDEAKQVVLLVGGPDGLSESCRQRANQQWSLSRLTLPHPMVRVIVAESLYRAWSLNTGHPYHRGG